MERKHKIEVILAILVLVALLCLLWFLLRSPDEEVTEDQEVEDATLDEDVDLGDETVVEISEEELQQIAPSTIARSFVERFGSYSTDGGYDNVEDVMAIATPSLASRLQDLAEQARESAGEEYYGISTSVLTISTVSESDTAATLSIGTRRTESEGNPGNSNTFNQAITIDLVADDLSWLVDDFLWE